MTHARPLAGAEDQEVLSPEDAAAMLKIPRKTFLGLCRRGFVPGAQKIGRHWRVTRSALMSLLSLRMSTLSW